jgi:2-hydroxychromene-2-carboxylate isomerase
MGKQVEFFFDFGSPTAYLAYKRLPQIARDTGADIVWRPMLLGGVFKSTGNASPVMVPAKGAYMFKDMARFAKKFAVPLAMNPHFPINTLPLMRIAAGLVGDARFAPFVEAAYNAMWAQPRNMGDPDEIRATLNQAGLDGAALLALAEDPAAKDRLKTNTEEAVSRGAFGAPTFFVGEEMFFGQDRLEFVAEALGG